MDITTTTSGGGHLFFGDVTGIIKVINHSMNVVLSFQAYAQKVTHMKLMKQKNVFISIGVC